jgi:hypothetical protein
MFRRLSTAALALSRSSRPPGPLLHPRHFHRPERSSRHGSRPMRCSRPGLRVRSREAWVASAPCRPADRMRTRPLVAGVLLLFSMTSHCTGPSFRQGLRGPPIFSRLPSQSSGRFAPAPAPPVAARSLTRSSVLCGRLSSSRRKEINMCKVLHVKLAGRETNKRQGLHWQADQVGQPVRDRPRRRPSDVIEKHRRWVVQQPHLMASLHELRSRDLVCFCAPLACHGDVFSELANKRQE